MKHPAPERGAHSGIRHWPCHPPPMAPQPRDTHIKETCSLPLLLLGHNQGRKANNIRRGGGVRGTTRLNILFLCCFNVCSRHCRTGRICHVYTLSTPYNRGLSEEVDRGTNVLLYGLEPQKVPPNTPNVIICSGFTSDIPLEKAHSMAEFGFLTGPQGEL